MDISEGHNSLRLYDWHIYDSTYDWQICISQIKPLSYWTISCDMFVVTQVSYFWSKFEGWVLLVSLVVWGWLWVNALINIFYIWISIIVHSFLFLFLNLSFKYLDLFFFLFFCTCEDVVKVVMLNLIVP